MPNTTTDAVDTNIKIYDRYQPALTAGFYKVEVDQQFRVDANPQKNYTSSLTFEVAAEQFSISPQLVSSVFPPADSLGDFTTVLPHMTISRSTFPWERRSDKASTDKPWVALLLFSEDELAPKVDFKQSPQDFHNSFSLDTMQRSDAYASPVSLVLVGKDLRTNIFPKSEEIAYLAHVRGKIGNEQAVIVANRLPFRNKRNFVHLVSLEESFAGADFVGKPGSGGDYYQFVSLYNWEFFCTDHFIVTPELFPVFKSDKTVYGALESLQNAEYFDAKDFIDAIAAVTGSPVLGEMQKRLLATFEVSHLNQILSHLNRTPNTLRLPQEDDSLNKMGYLRVDYKLKTGELVNGVYRGPLVPFLPDASNGVDQMIADPPLSSDSWFTIIKDKDDVVDISYAAAWELGRLMALADKKFSAALFLWKRDCYQRYKTNAANTQFPDMPEEVRTWFNNLVLLKNIPFNYLVPTEQYLPFEAIRFFCIDTAWVHCLVDGAFSIARFSELDANIDHELYAGKHPGVIDVELFQKQNPRADVLTQNPKSGFFLRSRAVSGWPDMVIEGATVNKKANLVKTNLSSNLFFCQFDSLIDTVVMYQRPESIHFGLEEDEDDKLFAMSLTRSPQKVAVVPVNNKIDISTLYNGMQATSVSNFAAGLIQKVEQVKFTVSS